MIYNENGYILTESITVGKTTIVLPSDYILETYSDDEDKKVKELKDLFKECDNESIDKIKSIDKKYKYVTERVRKLLKVLSGVSAGVGFSGLIGAAFTKSNKAMVILVAIFAVFTPLFLILDSIVSKTEKNKQENHKEISKLRDEVIKKLTDIKNNSKLPQDIRDKAENNLSKLKSKVESEPSREEDYFYTDTKVGGYKLKVKITTSEYEKNETYYNNALKKIDNQLPKLINQVRKKMIDDDIEDEYVDTAKSDEFEYSLDYVTNEYYSDSEDGDVTVSGNMGADDVGEWIPLIITYRKSGKN